MLRKLLFTSAALLTLSVPASAAVVSNFGLDPDSAAGIFNHDPNGPGVGGTFFDQYLFQLDAGTWITVTNATNTFAAGGITGTFGIQNFTGAIYEIVGLPDILPGGDDILRFGPQSGGPQSRRLEPVAQRHRLIPTGNYYLAIAVTPVPVRAMAATSRLQPYLNSIPGR